jgi:hypothetical protein
MLVELTSFLNANLTTPVMPLHAAELVPYPVIVYSLTADRPIHALDGSHIATNSEIRFQVQDTDHANVDAISQQLQTLLDGYRGYMGDDSGLATLTVDDLATLTIDQWATMTIDGNGVFTICRLDNDNETAQIWDTAADRWIFVRAMDFSIRYRNS